MGNFSFTKTGIEGLVIVETKLYGDDRGFFTETYNKREFEQAGITARFVQDNHSKSVKGVLRGMHFQIKNPQGKLVRVISGEVFDVALDMRPDSGSFGNWFGISLSEENRRQLYIPEGFAHGFYVLSDTAQFVYKCTQFYHPEDEGGVRYNDERAGIEWPCAGSEPIVSTKDLALPDFQTACRSLGISEKSDDARK